MFKRISDEERKFKQLTDELLSKFKVSRATLFYFLNANLERMSVASLELNDFKLQALESQRDSLVESEKDSKAGLEKLALEINTVTETLARLKDEEKLKMELLENQKAELDETKKRIERIENDIKEHELQQKQADYTLMISNHELKKKTDTNLKYSALMLTIISLLGVIIALIIHQKK